MPDRTCSVDGCDRPAKTRGWCATHYRRWQRTGNPGAAELMRQAKLAPGATCSVDGCDRPEQGKTFCRLHYQRFAKTGDPLGLRLVRPPERERFWAKVMTGTAEDCWEWQGPRNPAGYGIFFTYPAPAVQVNRPAHRYAYEDTVGSIADGLVIDHLCRNPSCVNPAHLEPVTQQMNVLRGPTNLATLNASKTHCPQGHAYDEVNTLIYKGSRVCRACNRIRQAAYQARKKARLAADAHQREMAPQPPRSQSRPS